MTTHATDDAPAVASSNRGRVARALAVLAGAVIAWWVISGSAHDAQVAAHEARLVVPVVAVDTLGRSVTEKPMTVTVLLHGEQVDLWGDLPDASVGDEITVVVDPADPSHVMDVATHTGGVYSPAAIVAMGVAFGAVPVAVVWWITRPRQRGPARLAASPTRA